MRKIHTHTHTHTHTYISNMYIYIYIYICSRVMRIKVVIVGILFHGCDGDGVVTELQMNNINKVSVITI